MIPCAKDIVLAKYPRAEVTRGPFGLVVVTDDTHAKKLAPVARIGPRKHGSPPPKKWRAFDAVQVD